MRHFLLRERWSLHVVAALLLFGTSGLAITRMTCLMGGHTVWTLGAMEDCCPGHDDGEGPRLAAECCLFAEAGGLAGPFVGGKAPLLDGPGPASPFPALAPVFLASAHRFTVRLSGRPPTLAPAERLAVLSVFRI
jgi:hypothetical protein